MNANDYVDSLFARYETNAELEDFKEEVTSNLLDRIRELETAGQTPDRALATATEELGDIGEIALEMSRRRTRDVFDSMYLHRKVRPDSMHILAYILGGAAVVAGAAMVAVTWAGGGSALAVTAWAVGLVAAPTGFLVAVALTQETTSNMPLPAGRAVGYGAAVFLMLAGLLLGAGTVLHDGAAWPTALAVGLPVLLVGVGLATWLGLTQTNRRKPWLQREVEERTQVWAERFADPQGDPERWARFGLFTVALWIAAVAVLVLVGLLVGFQYSWTALLFALAGQMLLLAGAMKGPRGEAVTKDSRDQER